MKKGKNVFFGVFFVLAAAFVIASQFGVFGGLGFWTILAGVVLLGVMISSIPQLNFFGILLPLALMYMIFQRPLDWIYISPWLLIAAAVLGSTGLSMLFRRRPRYHTYQQIESENNHGGYRPEEQSEEGGDDNHSYAKVSFGAASKYLHSSALENGQFIVSFGSMEVFFDQAVLSPAGADIFVDCSFGTIKLYIPKSWKVKDDVGAMLGGVSNDDQFSRPDENSPVLRITGNVQFGEIEIQYV